MQSTIRSEFPVTRHYAYFDVANKCAPPARVLDAVCEFFRQQSETGGDKESWFAKADEVKAKFARLIGANPSEIALVKNTFRSVQPDWQLPTDIAGPEYRCHRPGASKQRLSLASFEGQRHRNQDSAK